MGDRSQVVIHDSGSEVYLYTHWNGKTLPSLVAGSLFRGKSRWDDAPYLARIIFSDMIRGDIDGLTGYGISSTYQDSNHPDIHIYVERKLIKYDGEDFDFQMFIDNYSR